METPTLGGSTDSVVGMATTHELSNKTVVAQVVKTGLTASGSAANDFSASTGAFKPSTGLFTAGGQTDLIAGTTALAPLRFPSGTIMTTPVAGGMYFDGKKFMGSPVASAPGVIPTRMFSIVPAATFVLQTAAGVQSAFPTTGDVWTLAATTTYEVEGLYYWTRGGSDNVTTAMAFAFSSAPTSLLYFADGASAAINTTGTAQSSVLINTAATTVVLATSTATAQYVRFKGIIRTNGATTVTPQIDFSGTVTTPVMAADSYVTFTPLGTNTENILGNVG